MEKEDKGFEDINEFSIPETDIEKDDNENIGVNPVVGKKLKQVSGKVYTAKIIGKGKSFVDINFMDKGIRIKTDRTFNSETVEVKYKGSIGKPDFEYSLV